MADSHDPQVLADHLTPRMKRWRSYTSGPLTVLAVGSLPLLALDFIRSDLTTADRAFIDVVDVVVFAAFTIDFLVQLWMTPRRARFVRMEWIQLVLVVSQALAIVPALTHLGWLRVLRAAAPARVVVAFAEVMATSGLASHRGREFLRQHSARFAISLAGFTWITASVAFTIAEDVPGRGGNDSFGDGMWWAISTITTVGYGDIAPTTAAGRVVGGITMVVGAAAFAVVTASIAQYLLSPVVTKAVVDAADSAAVAVADDEVLDGDIPAPSAPATDGASGRL